MQSFQIQGPVLFTPKRHGDHRGYFAELFRQDQFDAAVGPTVFVQDNHSYSAQAGTLRGLHFQTPPRAQGKLVRCGRGSLFDVAVDIRVGSPTYGQHVSALLSAENGAQLWVPAGFAHGFCSLEPDTEIVYKVTDYYSPENDRGLAFDDPALGIDWPIDLASAVVSDKDRRHPRLADLPPSFQV